MFVFDCFVVLLFLMVWCVVALLFCCGVCLLEFGLLFVCLLVCCCVSVVLCCVVSCRVGLFCIVL